MNVEVGRLHVSVTLARPRRHSPEGPAQSLERVYRRERRWHDLEESRAYRALIVRPPVI